MNTIGPIPPSRPAPVLRTAAGALDHEAYARRARRLRAETLGALIESLARRLRSAAVAALGTIRARRPQPQSRCRTPC